MSRSELLNTLHERGLIHQCTDLDALSELTSKESVTAYIGFDCTADSLHVGHLLSIMTLRWLQKCGHRPIALLGGGTTKVGDPSGRDETRQILTEEQIAANVASIGAIMARYLDFGEGPGSAILVNNAAWLDELRYIPFLRDVGRHFSVNRMLTFDSVKSRLEREHPLSFLEFNYMVLQAYDFVELNRRHGCVLQMGGSDQWGNIVNGVELGRRIAGAQLYGLTTPLVTNASGAKMGKTAAGAVWLKEARLPAYDFYQFWRNTEDADVGRFLRLFTELPIAEIEKLQALEGAEINEAKKLLALEATALAHGRAAAESAAETARATFEQGGLGEDLPVLEVPAGELASGIPAYELFRRAGLTASNGEARRLIKGGGARLNDQAIRAEDFSVGPEALLDGVAKLSAGKKRHALVRTV